MVLFILMILILLISFILLTLNMLISKKEWLDRNKIISFECGFDSMSSSRLPFSIHFYLFGILFLIFDIEIVYLFPIIDLFNELKFYNWIYLSFILILILYLGLEYEKYDGNLKWFF